MQIIKTHKDLEVFNLAFEPGIALYFHSKESPTIKKYSLTDQIRRSSRSEVANITEVFRKRRYPKSFVSNLST